MMLPELQHLKTVRQLAEEYPHLFTEPALRWLIFNRETNGFDRCILRVGKRIFIDTRQLEAWFAEHRGAALRGRSGGREKARQNGSRTAARRRPGRRVTQ